MSDRTRREETEIKVSRRRWDGSECVRFRRTEDVKWNEWQSAIAALAVRAFRTCQRSEVKGQSWFNEPRELQFPLRRMLTSLGSDQNGQWGKWNSRWCCQMGSSYSDHAVTKRINHGEAFVFIDRKKLQRSPVKRFRGDGRRDGFSGLLQKKRNFSLEALEILKFAVAYLSIKL